MGERAALDATAIGGGIVGVLIALFIFFAVQGLFLDLSIAVAVAFVATGFILQARDKRRARRATVEQALGEAEMILKGKG